MQRINRYPSPLTPLINDGTGDISHGDYDVAIDNVEAGTYVFAADVQNSGTQTGVNIMLFDSAWKPLLISDKIGHVKTTLTLGKSDHLVIRPNQTGVTISNVIVERADTYAIAAGGGGFRASSPRRPRPISPQFGGGRVRIRNLYDPPTLKDYPANVPWVPDGATSAGETTADGWKVTVPGSGTGWLYPPHTPDGCLCVCWQRQDGT